MWDKAGMRRFVCGVVLVVAALVIDEAVPEMVKDRPIAPYFYPPGCTYKGGKCKYTSECCGYPHMAVCERNKCYENEPTSNGDKCRFNIECRSGACKKPGGRGYGACVVPATCKLWSTAGHDAYCE